MARSGGDKPRDTAPVEIRIVDAPVCSARCFGDLAFTGNAEEVGQDRVAVPIEHIFDAPPAARCALPVEYALGAFG